MFDQIIKLKHVLIKREKIQVTVLFAVIVITAFTQALGVASVLPFIALVMEPGLVHENQWLNWAFNYFNFSDIQSFTIAAGFLMFAVILFSNTLSALTMYGKIKFAWMNNHRLSLRLLKKYLSMPYHYFLNKHSADIIRNVLNEVNHLTNSFLLPLLMLFSNTFLILFILAMLVSADVIVSLISIFLLGGSYMAIYTSISRKLKERGDLRLKANLSRFQVVAEALGGLKDIKILHRENFFLSRYNVASKENVSHVSWSSVIGQLPKFALETIAFGGIILFIVVLLVIGRDVQQVVSLAALFAFAGYRIMPALQEIFKSFTLMQFNSAVLHRIYEDLGKGKELGSITFDQELPEPLPFQREIKLRQLTFYYPNTEKPIFKEFNLVIRRNTSIALVGMTGAGKTTLVDIILGLLLPRGGSLMVDGITVDENNLLNWQRNLGYVPQSVFLSDDTVTRNIAFGLPDKEIDMATVERVAKVANIHDFVINELPDGYNTRVGERGIRLSGGQRQRIGIARALYNDPEVLVFDEATSALDGVTEDAVLSAMENAARTKTLIIIAHRLTTVKNCNQIYLLDRGKIVDQGTYEELLSSNKNFQAMAKINARNR